jgi:hypothetical protein
MKWKDIKNKFKNQWVLIEVEKVDENFNPLEGEVLAHSKDKDEIYQKLLIIKPKEFSIEFTGEVPEDLAVVMVIVDESLSS